MGRVPYSTISPSSSPQIGVNKPLPHSPLTRQSSISANVKQAPQSPTPSAVKPLPKPPVLKLVDEPPPSGGPLTMRPSKPMRIVDRFLPALTSY